MIKKNKHTEKHMTANAGWHQCGERKTLIHCCWDCKLMQPASLEISVQNSFSVKTIKKSRRKCRDGSVFKNTYYSFRGLEFSSKGSSVLFWSLDALHSNEHTHTETHLYVYIHNLKVRLNKSLKGKTKLYLIV